MISYCCIFIEGDHVGGPYILLLFFGALSILYEFEFFILLAVLAPIAGTIGMLVSALNEKDLKNEVVITFLFLAMLSPFLIDIFSGSSSSHRDQTTYHITLSIFIAIGSLMLISVFMNKTIENN